MGRRRKDSLPRYWQLRSGTYWYKVPRRFSDRFDVTMVKLGRTLPQAHQAFAALPIHDDKSEVETIGGLLIEYGRIVVPGKAPHSQTNNRRSIANLTRSFGHIPIKALRPHHVLKYYDARGQTRSAKADIEVLSHAFSKAVEWGAIDRHPFIGQLRFKGQRSRDRYVTDDELIKFFGMLPKKWKAYVLLKLATGLSKQDLLSIKLSDLREDGLHAHRRKTNARGKVYLWDQAGTLKAITAMVIDSHKGHVGSFYLFHTRGGKPYVNLTPEGRHASPPTSFNSIWQRYMAKWVAGGGTRFTEHDLRAKAASDEADLEHARQLLDHTRPEVTERIYRRAPTVLEVAKNVSQKLIDPEE